MPLEESDFVATKQVVGQAADVVLMVLCTLLFLFGVVFWFAIHDTVLVCSSIVKPHV